MLSALTHFRVLRLVAVTGTVVKTRFDAGAWIQKNGDIPNLSFRMYGVARIFGHEGSFWQEATRENGSDPIGSIRIVGFSVRLQVRGQRLTGWDVRNQECPNYCGWDVGNQECPNYCVPITGIQAPDRG